MAKQTVIYRANPVLTRLTLHRAALSGLKSKSKRGSRRRWQQLKAKRQVSKRQNKLARLQQKLIKGILNVIIAVSVLVLAVWQGPKLYYSLFPAKMEQAQAEELVGDFELHVDEAQLTAKKDANQGIENFRPPYNENLPEGDWLVIPRLGVRSTLQQTDNYDEALATGLWWAPGFGSPGSKDAPLIVAGHRFGFKWWWENDYWQYHSFYLLPRLEPGDTVEVISGKRKYLYEIYAGEEGTEITDYQADLILYTCKHLDSPVRIFRYARLLASDSKTLLNNLE